MILPMRNGREWLIFMGLLGILLVLGTALFFVYGESRALRHELRGIRIQMESLNIYMDRLVD